MSVIASREAILRAAQAAPGAVSRSLPPQDGSPWIGQLPSYSMQPGPDFTRPYGPFLPRPPETFTQGAFGPFSPILPVPIDQPPPGFDRAQPRRQQLYVGWNLPVGQPGSEGYRLTSYATMKTLADTYSILRACLNIRKNEIRALDWDIAMTPDAANAYQRDREATRDFHERRAKAKKFFQRPDSDYDNFESWLYALTEQLFVYDAVSIYMCPKKGTGLRRGLLGSDLDELWLIDGTSIRPLVGLHGERPRPPAPAWQQYEFGVPRADLTVISEGLDLDGSEGRLRAMLRGDQLMYRPYERRPGTPYGFSLIEQALIPIMTGLRKQAYQLDYFSESSVPRVWLSPGDATMTPNQIRELQEALNAISGDLAWAFKVMVVPPNSKIIPQKDMQIVDDSDNWIANEVAMILNVSPTEINLLPKVSAMASPFAAREMAQAARSIHERVATKPTLSYLTAIPDFILQVVCGQDDMRFVFEGMEATEDMAASTDMGIKQVQSGIKTIDEVRDDLNMTRFDLPETRVPVVFTQMGPIPLGQAADQAQAAGTQAAGDGHRAVSGTPRRKALPAGTSGQGRMNGPVTQRQARRGGALAPAHATGEGAPGHSGGKPAPKAVLAELDALRRHLNKGMLASEWVPVHIPAVVMAEISEDLGKGLSVDYVIKAAGAHHRKPAQPAGPSQQQLASQAQQRVRGAFASAIGQAQALIAQFIAGTLAVSAAVLAGMVADLIRVALTPALVALWTAAWDAGVRSAGGDPADTVAELEAFLATEGAAWASVVSGTGMAALLAAITAALRAGDVSAIVEMLWALLGVDQRSEVIATSETTRAWNAGAFAWMKKSGIAYKRWVTRNDAKVCARCLANQAQGAVPLDQPFSSGDLTSPIHPNCRCVVVAADPPPFTGKRLRRQVGLNGQETWVDQAEPFDYSGGRVFQPHRGDGTMVPTSPGAVVHSEPPRWDGSEVNPIVEHVPEADDSAAYGATGRPGPVSEAYWPAPYMDGWWPRPAGHGTGQPGGMSPGGARGVPPSPAGKASKPLKAAAFARAAPKATPAAVLAVMRENFPDSALGWVRRIRWSGPVDIPVALVDRSHSDEWAARHEQGHVDDIARQVEAGEHVNPVIAVFRKGHDHLRMVDGRHRLEAHAKLGRPVPGFIGWLDDANEQAAYDTYHAQRHSGDSPQNKSFTAGNLGVPGAVSGLVPLRAEGQKVSKASVNYRPAADLARSCGTCSMLEPDGSCSLVEGCIATSDVCDEWEPREAGKAVVPHDESCVPAQPLGAPYCAGLVVRAADSGRLLMLQRAASESDDGAGLLEWPGGHADEGESLLAAAIREFAEEVGIAIPAGELTGHWESSNGVYSGFVLTIPREADVDLAARDLTANPDGDAFLAAIWVDPAHLGGNQAVRAEVRTDLPLLLAALAETVAKSARGQTSAEVLREYWRGEAHPGPTQFALERKIKWGEPDDWYRCVDELTPYIGAEGAKGYCNLRHHEVLGYWPAQHARMEREGKE